MRGPIQRNTVSLDRTAHEWAVLFSETVFLWIGPLFRRIGPRVSQDRTFSKTNAPIPKKHPVCQRVGHILDYESPRKHDSSVVAWEGLRWKRIFLRMDQWSKTTSHFKRDSDTMQHGELRSCRGSRLVNEFFLQFSSFNFNDTFKTREALLVFFTNYDSIKWQWDSRKRGSKRNWFLSSACVKFKCWW